MPTAGVVALATFLAPNLMYAANPFGKVLELMARTKSQIGLGHAAPPLRAL